MLRNRTDTGISSGTRRSQVLIAAGISLLAFQVTAQQAYTTIESTPVTYKMQGEYFGTFDDSDDRLGCWIWTVPGSHEYELIFLLGGLAGPADNPVFPEGGWDTKTKFRGRAESGDDSRTLEFDLQGYSGKIEGEGYDKVMTGTKDGRGFTLNRVGRKEAGLPSRQSPTLGAPAPAAARVLFDGTQQSVKDNWNPSDKFESSLEALQWGVTSKYEFNNVQLHIEWLTPYRPGCDGQCRGNSGVYLQGRYEIQVLDSFGWDPDMGHAGGIYSQNPPYYNASLPPLTWQTYDAYFWEPKWGAGGKEEDAKMTVYHNGLVIQENEPVDHATTAAVLNEGTSKGPLYLQDHGNPVHYGNIWIIENETDWIPIENLFPEAPVSASIGPESASKGSRPPSPRIQLRRNQGPGLRWIDGRRRIPGIAESFGGNPVWTAGPHTTGRANALIER